MKEKTINIYKYDELNEKAKDKVLSYFRENNDYYFIEESLNESLNIKLEENKIKVLNDLDLCYSLGYCQGDGLSFLGLFKWNGYNIEIGRGNWGNYVHFNNITLEIFKEDEEGNEKDAPKEIEEEFKDLYDSICNNLEKEGYSFIESEDSEENIKENIEANEYTFRSNGEMENI